MLLDDVRLKRAELFFGGKIWRTLRKCTCRSPHFHFACVWKNVSPIRKIKLVAQFHAALNLGTSYYFVLNIS